MTFCVKKVFSDFDGTLTESNGSLSQHFIAVLDLLREREVPLTIVTGRSLSWGHFFLTHFPQVYSVICEGGGVLIYKDSKGKMREENLVSEADYLFLDNVASSLIKYFDCPLSLDSFGRRTDRAIELSEFEKDEKLKQEVETFLKDKGITFSSSNVHLNFWKGDISKSKAMKYLLRKMYPKYSYKDCLFFGDAPNDESVFEEFPNSVGVSNISPYLKEMKNHPRIILKGVKNEGVKGVLNYLLGEEKAS